MYCLQCGKEIPEGAKFCIYCGTAVQKRDEANAPPVNDFQAEQGAAPVKRKGGTKGLLIAVVLVAALAAFVALAGSFSGSTKGPKLVGTYEDSSGLMGAIQFNKDSTFYYGGGLFGDSYDSGVYMADYYGTYSFGDDNSTIYLKTDDSCEGKIEYLGASWTYEKESDVIAVAVEGYTLTFYKSDAVVRLPEDTAEGSEAEAEAEETASETEKAEQIENLLNLPGVNGLLHSSYTDVRSIRLYDILQTLDLNPMNDELRNAWTNATGLDASYYNEAGLPFELYYITGDDLDALLRKCTGYGISDVVLDLENVTYLPSIDVYCAGTDGSSYCSIDVVSISELDDDIIEITYGSDYSYDSDWYMKARLKDLGNSQYQIISNMPVE